MTSTLYRASMSEAALQDTLIDACGALGLPVFHIRDSRRNMGEGFPDLVIADWRSGIARFWELKTERGSVRPKQQEWLAMLARCHAVDVQLIRPDRLDWALEELAR
jgi:hypothetical protein